MTEAKAAAILSANVKGGSKPSNVMDVARACRILSKSWGWDKMASFLNASTTQLRQIDKINDLVPEAKKLVRAGKLRIEASYQLSRVDEKRQAEAARLAQSMKAHEVRRLVNLLLTDKNLSPKDARNSTFKEMRREVNMLVLPLTSETYGALELLSKRSKTNLHDYVLRIIEKHIANSR